MNMSNSYDNERHKCHVYCFGDLIELDARCARSGHLVDPITFWPSGSVEITPDLEATDSVLSEADTVLNSGWVKYRRTTLWFENLNSGPQPGEGLRQIVPSRDQRGSKKISIGSKVVDGCQVLTLNGKTNRVAAWSYLFRELCAKATSHKAEPVILNVKQVALLSAVIGCIVGFSKTYSRMGVVTKNPELFHMLRLDTLFPVYASLHEALQEANHFSG